MPRANLRVFEETLKKKHLFVFGTSDLVRLFGWSRTAVRFLLHRYTRRGITVRLKNDLYTLSGVAVPEQYIANRLYDPSYVSLETALSLGGVIPETVYAVTSVTTRKACQFDRGGRNYAYHHVKPRAFTGYVPFKQGDFTSLVAEPEKAIVDYYYLVVHGNRKPLDMERLRLDRLKPAKVEKYVRLFDDARLARVLKDVFAQKHIALSL